MVAHLMALKCGALVIITNLIYLPLNSFILLSTPSINACSQICTSLARFLQGLLRRVFVDVFRRYNGTFIADPNLLPLLLLIHYFIDILNDGSDPIW